MFQPYPHDIMDSFKSISAGFAKYSPSDFQFVSGQVTGIDTDKCEISYKAKSSDDAVADATSELAYDTLVIATGSRSLSPLFSVHDSHLPTLEAYKEMHARIPSAKSVVIVGGGSAGVETAGEVAFLYGKGKKTPKDLTIYSGSSRLLPALQPGIGASAEQKLTGMGVKVVHSVKLESSSKLPSGETEIKFDDGNTKAVDILIVATGRRANAPFLPSTIPTDSKGRIETDKSMRVPSQRAIWAVGDISSQSDGTVMHIQFALPTIAGNIVADLTGKGKVKDFKPMTTKEMQLVPIGPQDGVGAMFGWKVPGFVVKMIKGKDYMFPKSLQWVNG